MKNITGDLFSHIGKADAICITTNGFVKRNGEAVMGRGCALKAINLCKALPSILGNSISIRGNNVAELVTISDTKVFAFPVKPVSIRYDGKNVVEHMKSRFRIGDLVPGWAAKADLALIDQSAFQLMAVADKLKWTNVILPRPGCGAGELKWEDVEPILQRYLDDRFSSITFGGEA